MGNLTQVTEPAPEGGTHLTTYAYNVLNQLTTVTMPRSTGTQTRTFNYDFTGNYPYSGPTARLTSVTNPESGTTSFEYNDDGSLFRKTDAKGQKIKLTYDTLGRVTVKQTYKSDGTEDLCGKATNYWDTRPSGVGGADWENVSGRLMAVRWSASTCPGGQFTEGYQYDTGLLTIKRLYAPPLGTNSYIDASFTYTDQGQLQSMAYPVWHGGGTQWPTAGKTFTYNLDTLSRPIGLTDEVQASWVSGVTYGTHDSIMGPAGQMTTMIYGGYTENFSYNERGQLTNLTATGTGLATVNLQYNFPATPSNDGRLTQMKDLAANPVEEVNYYYDSLGRLTDAHTTGAQWGQTFSYDGFGNLTEETATKGTPPPPSVHRNYDPATNRLTLDYTYDANGNMTAMPGLGMTYNVENRLTQATSNLNGTESYDPAGLRLWKQGPDTVTHVYYNGPGGKPLADFYLSGGSMAGGTPMVYFAGKRVDNSSVEDVLGTAVVEGGQKMAYFPYGELRSGTSTEVQFATYKRDSTTNLDYAHHRYYSSQIARFTTPDPHDGSAHKEIPQSWNRYSYAGNDPINHNDRSGGTDCSVNPDSGDIEGCHFSIDVTAETEEDVEEDETDNDDQDDRGADYEVRADQVKHSTGPAPLPNWKKLAQLSEHTWANVFAGIIAAQAALANADCAGLFNVQQDQKIPSASTLLASIASGLSSQAYFTVGDLGAPSKGLATNAATEPSAYAMEPGGSVGYTGRYGHAVVIFNYQPTAPFNSGSWNYMARTILHELGHVYMDLYGQKSTKVQDDTSKDTENPVANAEAAAQSAANTALVEKNCFPEGI